MANRPFLLCPRWLKNIRGGGVEVELLVPRYSMTHSGSMSNEDVLRGKLKKSVLCTSDKFSFRSIKVVSPHSR